MPFGPLLLVLSVTSALPIFLSVSRLPTDRAEDLQRPPNPNVRRVRRMFGLLEGETEKQVAGI